MLATGPGRKRISLRTLDIKSECWKPSDETLDANTLATARRKVQTRLEQLPEPRSMLFKKRKEKGNKRKGKLFAFRLALRRGVGVFDAFVFEGFHAERFEPYRLEIRGEGSFLPA